MPGRPAGTAETAVLAGMGPRVVQPTVDAANHATNSGRTGGKRGASEFIIALFNPYGTRQTLTLPPAGRLLLSQTKARPNPEQSLVV